MTTHNERWLQNFSDKIRKENQITVIETTVHTSAVGGWIVSKELEKYSGKKVKVTIEPSEEKCRSCSSR